MANKNGSKADTVVKLVLVFFIALLSFSIGTFVGKKFSDNQHKLAQLEPTVPEHTSGSADREIASISPDAHAVKPNDALSDDEIAKLAEEFVADEEMSEGVLHDKAVDTHTVSKALEAEKGEYDESADHEEKGTHTEPVKAVAKKEPVDVKKEIAAVSKVAERLAQGKPAVTAKETKAPTNRIPAALPNELATSALGKYTVQIASYASEKEAQTRTADLKTQGFNSFYITATVKGKTWYRVGIGLFSTEKEAKAYKNDLLSRTKVTSAIVQKITSTK